MKDKEKMIELGGGIIISKTVYQNALKEYYKTHKIDGVAPLTYDGKVIGCVYNTLDGDIKRMTIEIATDEGKKIINQAFHQPIGISARKTGNILEDGTVDDSQPFTEQKQPGKRAWLFHCTNKIRTYKLSVYIEDIDRESAIAQFEGIHHDLEWWQTTEVKFVC